MMRAGAMACRTPRCFAAKSTMARTLVAKIGTLSLDQIRRGACFVAEPAAAGGGCGFWNRVHLCHGAVPPSIRRERPPPPTGRRTSSTAVTSGPAAAAATPCSESSPTSASAVTPTLVAVGAAPSSWGRASGAAAAAPRLSVTPAAAAAAAVSGGTADDSDSDGSPPLESASEDSSDDGGGGAACRRVGKADLVPLRHALRADVAAAPPPSRATVSPTSRRNAYIGGAGSGGSATAGILEGVPLHRQRANEKEPEKARGGLGHPRFEVGGALRDDVACHDFFA